MSVWPDWLKVIQLKPRFLFGLWLLGCLILFMPNKLSQPLGITNIREQIRQWIGLGTLAAFTFWCVQLIPEYRSWRDKRKFQKEVINSVASLSPEEGLLLAYCLSRNHRTITLEVTHRVAGALKAKGMLIMASGVGNQLAWPFTVPSFLWKYLEANPHVVSGGMKLNDPNLQEYFSDLDRHIRRYDAVI